MTESRPASFYENRTIDQLKEALVFGLRVATGEGILDQAGHISMRIPGTDEFLINPRFAPALAEPEDIATVDLKSGKKLDGPFPIPSEAIIHRSILLARPDIQSVIHFHSRFLILCGVLELAMRPYARDDYFFEDGVPVLDNATNVDSASLADEMVETLGSHRAMLLRGHGSVVTGVHPESAVIAALQLESMAHNVYEAHAVGRPDPRPARADDERVRAPGVLTREQHFANPYRLWPFYLEKHHVVPRERIRQMLEPPVFGG